MELIEVLDWVILFFPNSNTNRFNLKFGVQTYFNYLRIYRSSWGFGITPFIEAKGVSYGGNLEFGIDTRISKRWTFHLDLGLGVQLETASYYKIQMQNLTSSSQDLETSGYPLVKSISFALSYTVLHNKSLGENK